MLQEHIQKDQLHVVMPQIALVENPNPAGKFQSIKKTNISDHISRERALYQRYIMLLNKI